MAGLTSPAATLVLYQSETLSTGLKRGVAWLSKTGSLPTPARPAGADELVDREAVEVANGRHSGARPEKREAEAQEGAVLSTAWRKSPATTLSAQRGPTHLQMYLKNVREETIT